MVSANLFNIMWLSTINFYDISLKRSVYTCMYTYRHTHMLYIYSWIIHSFLSHLCVSQEPDPPGAAVGDQLQPAQRLPLSWHLEGVWTTGGGTKRRARSNCWWPGKGSSRATEKHWWGERWRNSSRWQQYRRAGKRPATTYRDWADWKKQLATMLSHSSYYSFRVRELTIATQSH